MPTFVTITVKPSGGDYTSLNTALAAVNSNLITSDEQVTIECDTFPGGLSEQVIVPSITQDVTRYLEIKAASGHEYNPVDDSGFFLIANIGFSGVFVNSQNFTRLHGIGVKNTRTLGSGRGVQWNGNDCVINQVYASTTSSSGAACFLLTNANNLTITDCLSYLGTTGYDFGNNNTRTATNLTSIDASSVGFDTGTADTTLTNCLTIGSSDPYLGTFNAASSNNAGDSTDTPGTSPFNNRTTADLANYALGDFRTASGSALATGGTGGTHIGYDVEPSAGGVDVNDTTTNTNSSSNQDTVLLVGEFTVNDSTTNTNSTSNADTVILVGEIVVQDSTTNTSSFSNSDTVIFAAQVNINDSTTNTNSASNSDTVLLSASVQVTDSVTNTNSQSNSDVVQLVGEFIVQDSITNTSSVSNPDSVVLASVVSVNDSTTNTNSISNQDLVSLVGQVIVSDSVTNSLSISDSDTVKLVGEITINDGATSTNSTSNKDAILIGSFNFTVYAETNITAKTLSRNIAATSYSTNING